MKPQLFKGTKASDVKRQGYYMVAMDDHKTRIGVARATPDGAIMCVPDIDDPDILDHHHAIFFLEPFEDD